MSPIILIYPILIFSLLIHPNPIAGDQSFISVLITQTGLDFVKNLLVTKAISSITPSPISKIDRVVNIPVIGKVHTVLSDITIYRFDIGLSQVVPGPAGVSISGSDVTCGLSVKWHYAYGSSLVPISVSDSGTAHIEVMRNHSVERKRWASVRSYLCGDELSSVLAEEDFGSRRSSKVAVNSVITEDYSSSARTSKATVFSSRIDDDSTSVKGSEDTVTQHVDEKTKIPSENGAAVVIQTAFRGFLVRRRIERIGQLVDTCDRDLESEAASVATSVVVQTGDSVVEAKDGCESFTHRTSPHKGVRVQTLKQKPKDWDDSTVSSNISKMRIQNRLEASTRRERALAYAFSQQLRICSKKKQNARSGNETEANMSWSWLERWMATRQHDTSFGDISKQFEQLNGNQKLMVKSRVISDLAGEEKESCGSNDISMHFDNVSLCSKTSEKSHSKPVRNRVKVTSLSRRKKPTSYGFANEYCKVNKQGEREIRCDDHEQ